MGWDGVRWVVGLVGEEVGRCKFKCNIDALVHGISGCAGGERAGRGCVEGV